MSTKDLNDVWRTTLAQIEVKLDSPATYKTYFQGAELLGIEKQTAMIAVPNPFISAWLKQKHHDLIKNTIAHVYGSELQIQFLDKQLEAPAAKAEPMALVSSLLDIQDGMHSSVAGAITKAGLNPKYTFSNFIVGETNRIAQAAAAAVMDKIGVAYNPLFVYGSTGVGKTHLAQAIGVGILERNPGRKVIYTTAENFMNDMVRGLRTAKMEEFRQKYRPCQVLVLDDIQMISKWVHTQTEFFNTFNELHNNNSQIVLIADRRPEDIKNIEERIRSRFQGGLVVEINQPDFELRLAILQRKAAAAGYDLSPRILETIARLVQDSIRELEGALQTVALFNQMKNGAELTVDEIARIIGADHHSKRGKVKVPVVLKVVAKEFGTTVKDLKGPRRTQELALARQVAMYILREELGYKLEEIAGFLGRSDHTTVMHAIDKVNALLMREDIFKNQVIGLIRKLNEHTVDELS